MHIPTRTLAQAALLCLAALMHEASLAASDAPFLTEAEGSACMGDDKSRKQTEEVAREEARRRAAEQAATQVRAHSRVSIGTLEEDVIKIMASGKVRILDVLDSTWDKDGCYTYRIRAEVTALRPGEGGAALNEEQRLWLEIEDKPDLRAVDNFLAKFPVSEHAAQARATQADLEDAYARVIGHYLVLRGASLYLRPAAQSIALSEANAGDLLQVTQAHDTHWAVVKRDAGQVYTQFRNLRPLTEDEVDAWRRVKKAGKDVRPLHDFLQTYPKSHLARLVQEQLDGLENRLKRQEGLSSRDSEEIALWDRCRKTQDLQCAREYRRRYPNGKFEKESWLIR